MSGRRVLISHPLVHILMGSTMVALELAEYLQANGDSVEVFTPHAANPALQLFHDSGIRVITHDREVNIGDFDLVWVHSQVMPESIARSLHDKTPLFIFNHMSPFLDIPDERPFIYEFEQRVSSLSLAVSPETSDVVATYFTDPPPMALFANPAPVSFCDMQRAALSTDLTSVLIVSNHRPPEVEQARALLRAQGIAVSHFGSGHEEYGRVTPELLARHDLVISIGKTVQYCLVSGTPVFVYDRFGGFGYLDESNFEQAARTNFTGRDGGSRWTAEELVERVQTGFSRAQTYQREHREAFVQRYGIQQVLPKVLLAAQPREVAPFDEQYELALTATHVFANRYWRKWGAELCLMEERSGLEQRVRELERERDALHESIDGILNSRSFRLGYRLLQPGMKAYHRIRGQRDADEA
jgi:hypothetical protein